MRRQRKDNSEDFWPKLLVEIRRERGMSQRRLSQLSGVRRMTINGWENDGRPAQMDQFERVMNVLGYRLLAMPRT